MRGPCVELSGGSFRNDHVAFRSLAFADRRASGIALFAPVFERLGWKRAGEYEFPDALLEAIHLSHPEGHPRVFLSQLRIERLPAHAQKILRARTVDPVPAVADAAWFCAPSAPPREADLLALEQVSQYAAWVYAFGRKVNHFTGAVSNVEQWQQRMRDAGVPMKAEIEGEPGGPLRQTATHAAPVELTLEGGGRRSWPYAYFEIAERNGGFDGFFTTQARALFDMTSRSVKKA